MIYVEIKWISILKLRSRSDLLIIYNNYHLNKSITYYFFLRLNMYFKRRLTVIIYYIRNITGVYPVLKYD